jgi:hypothetical protein
MKIGHKVWAIPGGHIPPRSTGQEPEFTSRDVLCLLNAGKREARLEMTVFYADGDPIGPYKLTVPARRVRHVRLNDLIDPQPLPLGIDYAVIIESSVPIVVQFTRLDSSQPIAIASTLAFAVP